MLKTIKWETKLRHRKGGTTTHKHFTPWNNKNATFRAKRNSMNTSICGGSHLSSMDVQMAREKHAMYKIPSTGSPGSTEVRHG